MHATGMIIYITAMSTKGNGQKANARSSARDTKAMPTAPPVRTLPAAGGLPLRPVTPPSQRRKQMITKAQPLLWALKCRVPETQPSTSVKKPHSSTLQIPQKRLLNDKGTRSSPKHGL